MASFPISSYMNTRIHSSKQARYMEGHSGFVYSLHALLYDILPGLLVEKVLKNRRQAKPLEQPNTSVYAVLMSLCSFLFICESRKDLTFPCNI